MARLVWWTLVFILIVHAVGIISGMYYRLWWLDIPMHLAGGAWVALLFLYLFTPTPESFVSEDGDEWLKNAERKPEKHWHKPVVWGFTERWNVFSDKGSRNYIGIFLLALGFVALVAVLWECYEYLYDVFIAERHGFLITQQGVSDTMGDLVNGLIGGAVVALVYLRSLTSK